jgi:ABC-type hemin transport system substrate-binding protein
MGVISVVSVLTSENWAQAKPDDYKGTELDKALQAWGTLANQTVEIPEDLIPAPPECKVAALTKYIDELKSVLKELDQAKALVNQYITSLKAVQAAGSKAAADLTKLSKGENLDERAQQKYTSAASVASSIASSAGSALKEYQ